MVSYLTYLILKSLGLFVNLLPERFALWVGGLMGKMSYYFDREHRKVAHENLRLAFGEKKSEREMKAIAKKCFQNLGMMATEFFQISRMDMEAFKRKVSVEGLEETLKVLGQKKGILLLLSHFGNWELMGFMSKVIRSPIMVIAKPVKRNPWVGRWVLKIREDAGLEVIPPVHAGRKVIKALSQNRLVGILIDQRAKRSEGIMVDFFGKEAPTTPGLAALAMKSGAPVVPVFMIRNGSQKHRLVIQKPLELIHTGNKKQDVEANTRLFNRTLESMIREYPDQWFWVHRRWERKKRAQRVRPSSTDD